LQILPLLKELMQPPTLDRSRVSTELLEASSCGPRDGVAPGETVQKHLFSGFAGETVSARAGLPIGAAADEQIARVLVAPLSFTVLGIR
jgi:hypothetical protein